MKLSPNFGEGGIKGWFVQNVEKVVLGMVGVIVIMYIWSGTKHKTIEPSKSSQSLQEAATLASGHIDVTKWDTIKEERFPIADNWEEMVGDSNIKVDNKNYPLPTIWNPPLFPLSTKRYDPPLLPLEEIHAIAGIGAFAVVGGDDEGTPSRGGNGREGNEAVFRPGGAAAVGARFAVITALIPTKAQTVKYKEKLEEAAGYDESRDTPKYFFFDVQRLEVTADGKPVTNADGKPATWITIGNEDTLKKVGEQWAGRSEVIDEMHIHEWLTMQPAPLLGETQDKYFVHPSIGRRVIEDPEAEEGRQNGHNQGHRTPVRIPGRDGPVRGGRDDVNDPDPHEEINPYEEPEIEYHLFRFYDVESNYDDVTLAPQAGKRYKYKVQVLLEDPNNPQEENYKPLDQDLHKDVIARIKTKPKAHFRATAFSSESEIVEFPMGIRVLAGAVGVGPVDPYIPFTLEPKTRILGIVWDNVEAAPVHGLFGNEDQKKLDKEVQQASAYRGQVVNTAKDVMKLDPFDDISSELEGYDVRTDAILLDIRGGHRLSPKPFGYSLMEPGELLLMDRNGRLIVQEEAADWREFDKLRPPVIEEEDDDDDEGHREIGGELLN